MVFALGPINNFYKCTRLDSEHLSSSPFAIITSQLINTNPLIPGF